MDAVDRLFTLVDSQYNEQQQFAQDIGLPPSVVSQWRRRKSASYTKPDRIAKIAAILGTTTEYILAGKKEPATVSSGELDSEVVTLLKQIELQGKMDEVKRYLRFQATPEEKQ